MQSIASAVIFRRNNHLNHRVILLTIFIAIYLNFNNINITFLFFFGFCHHFMVTITTIYFPWD
ncbi:putative membrane protein [Citrobacter freundii]|nr:putative membrane protein [Citrobacter freundii]